MIQITTTDTGVHAEIARLLRAVENPAPALKAVGELVVEFTKTRFEVSQDPYGKPWAPNSDTTLRQLLHSHGKNFTRKGSVSARGQRVLASKKPLIGESKSLSTQFAASVKGNAVEIRSSMIYAAMQQFGGSKSQFPKLWGDIPARPFFPDSQKGLPAALAGRIAGVLSAALLGKA
jgi:phage gpG-like protein